MILTKSEKSSNAQKVLKYYEVLWFLEKGSKTKPLFMFT